MLVVPMKISVIISYFNGSETLDWAIQSVIRQRAANWELILVDDGSTDDLAKHVGQIYARTRYNITGPGLQDVEEWFDMGLASYPQIKAVRQENLGVVGARNTGVHFATGEALLFLDGDDWIDSHFLEETSRILDNLPDVGIVSTGMHVFSENADSIINTPKVSLKDELRTNLIPNTSLIRTKAFIDGGMYKLNVYEDWNLWIDILKMGWNHFAIPAPLFHYRKHAGDSRIKILERQHDTLMRNMRALHPGMLK
jgi:hypothetical protein